MKPLSPKNLLTVETYLVIMVSCAEAMITMYSTWLSQPLQTVITSFIDKNNRV